MRKFKLIPLSIVAILAACGEDSSPLKVDVSSDGEQRYERHFEKDDFATMKCIVYATDKTVSLSAEMIITDDKESKLSNKLKVKVGEKSTPIYYQMEFSGVFSNSRDNACSSAKKSLSNQKNLKAECSDHKASSSADMGPISASQTENAISSFVEQFSAHCDSFYDSYMEYANEYADYVENRQNK